ncbi:MAG: cobalamin-dependent protein, partial [Promethearchaeota archaeon]
MPKKIAFLVFYHKYNKFSFNALVGALETNEIINYIDIYFISTKEELLNTIITTMDNYLQVVVGISFFTTQLWEIKNIIFKAKKISKNNVIFIAGGPHPTGDPLGTLNMGFDIVFIGESEESLIDFFQKLHSNRDYTNIKGTALLDDE